MLKTKTYKYKEMFEQNITIPIFHFLGRVALVVIHPSA